MLRSVQAAVFFGVIGGAAAHAEVIVVPRDYSTIQAAIDAAEDGDEVLVLPGTYAEHIEIGKAITVRSIVGPALTEIRGTGENVSVVRSHGAGVLLEGFTITNGDVPFVGGGLDVGGLATVRNCVFEGNRAGSGGGAFVNGGEVAFVRCAFAGNEAFSGGGAFASEPIEVVFRRCAFEGNVAEEQGGGLATDFVFRPLVLDGCRFIANAARDGGALHADQVTTRLDVDRCLFEDNIASRRGGAVVLSFVEEGTIDHAWFGGNVAGEAGGAIFIDDYSDGRTTIAASLFCDNEPEHIDGGWNDGGSNEFLDTCPPTCPGDLDRDGSVGFADLLRVLVAWGPCPGCPEDLDADGTVGFDDVLIVLAAWGPCA